MIQATRPRSLAGTFLIKRRYYQAALVISVLVCNLAPSWGQTAAAPATRPTTSLADSLKRVDTENTQLHIFYVHGMGADGPGASASADLRKSICKFLRDCTTRGGEFEGTDYADSHRFALDAPPPPLTYLGQQVWKTDASGGSEEWNASAPYVDHYKLVRKGSARTIYLDEINWWPLVFAAKCRQIIQEDAAPIGPNRTYFDKCRLQPTKDPDQKKNYGRFRTYPFMKDGEHLDSPTAKAAKFNRDLKTSVLDWGMSDALMAVGPMRSLFLEGIREIIQKSVKVSASGSRANAVAPAPNQEFAIVSHSLGSYLMFSALDLNLDLDASKIPEWEIEFENVLSRTSVAYFFANQLRLLELANLDDTKNGNLMYHLRTWGEIRQRHQKPVPQIVAWSDPSDLLTWSVPALDPTVAVVTNLPAKNAPHWFWYYESPNDAHKKYDKNGHVIAVLLKQTTHN